MRLRLALLAALVALANVPSAEAGSVPGAARTARKATRRMKLKTARPRVKRERRAKVRLTHVLDVARTLAREAGAVAMKYRGRVAKEKKEGGEAVTVADREASALIVEALQRQFPEDLVVSEESKDNWDLVGQAHRVWFIDPIDGTKEYLEGTDGFAVQIALVERSEADPAGRPVLGVVYQPSLDRMYFAAPGMGAHVEEPGLSGRITPSGIEEVSHLRLLVSNMNRSKYFDEFKEELGIDEETPMGSVGIKLGLIARGEKDITFKPSPVVKAWDIAAPHAILEAAGGRFTTMEGARFRYDTIHNRCGLLATNGRNHDAVAARLAPIYREVMVKKEADDAAKAARKAAKRAARPQVAQPPPGFPNWR
jgi:3'(2'), 5'-bisphosphate nucleotidase